MTKGMSETYPYRSHDGVGCLLRLVDLDGARRLPVLHLLLGANHHISWLGAVPRAVLVARYGRVELEGLGQRHRARVLDVREIRVPQLGLGARRPRAQRCVRVQVPALTACKSI